MLRWRRAAPIEPEPVVTMTAVTMSVKRIAVIRSPLGAWRSLVAQELYEQRAHVFRLLLLYPMPRSVHQMEAHHSRARGGPHFVHGSRSLIDAPVALPADEHR